MFVRVVALLSIVAVVACPLHCAGDSCHAGDCCRENAISPATTAATQQHECCCQQEVPADSHPCPDHPIRSSDCQGLCGGAIFERPCRDSVTTNCYYLSWAAPTTTVATFSSIKPRLVQPSDGYLASNGRALRTWLASFLC
jgi:hypothetical protein